MARRSNPRGSKLSLPRVVVASTLKHKRVISHTNFWRAYHWLTEGIVAGTDLAPYYSESEIEWNCEFQRKLRALMEQGIIAVGGEESKESSNREVDDSKEIEDYERVNEINFLSEENARRVSKGRGKSRGILPFRLPEPKEG